jgi:hypothetical protein
MVRAKEEEGVVVVVVPIRNDVPPPNVELALINHVK